MSNQNIKKHIPNLLTVLRLLFVPLFAMSFFWQHKLAHLLTFTIYSLAGFTDFFDGFLARIWNAQSNLGKILDHTVDKTMIFACCVMLIAVGKITNWHIVAVILLLSRDFFVAGIREMIDHNTDNLKSILSAKMKTVLQIFALGFLIMAGNHNNVFPFGYLLKNFPQQIYFIGYFLLWLAVFFSLYSGYVYYKNSKLQLM